MNAFDLQMKGKEMINYFVIATLDELERYFPDADIQAYKIALESGTSLLDIAKEAAEHWKVEDMVNCRLCITRRAAEREQNCKEESLVVMIGPAFFEKGITERLGVVISSTDKKGDINKFIDEYVCKIDENTKAIKRILIGKPVTIVGGHEEQKHMIGREAIIDNICVENHGITVHLGKIARKDKKSGFYESANESDEYYRLKHVEFIEHKQNH